jgi:DNA-binding NarL/FixJ family response regulator
MTDPGTLLRVVIADDQALVRAGFSMILEEVGGFQVVGEAADGEEAVAAVRRHRPDLVLMDVRMPNLDGIEATRRIMAGGASCRVVILTTFDLDEHVFAALRAGASGFLLKDVSPEQLVASLRLLASGEALLAPSITRRLIERFAAPDAGQAASQVLATLTEREREVLVLIARGRSNDELAAELHVGESTIKTHVGRVLAKLGLRDRVQAVVFAYENGLIQPGRAWPADQV